MNVKGVNEVIGVQQVKERRRVQALINEKRPEGNEATIVNGGQRKSTKVNASQRKSTMVNRSHRSHRSHRSQRPPRRRLWTWGYGTPIECGVRMHLIPMAMGINKTNNDSTFDQVHCSSSVLTFSLLLTLSPILPLFLTYRNRKRITLIIIIRRRALNRDGLLSSRRH